MVAHPRQAALPLCSVLITLYYCCRYHFEEPEVLHSYKLLQRGIFVYIVCLVSTSLSFSNQSAKNEILNSERALHNELSLKN